jgi:Transglutaminase-like superfamily
MFAPLYVAPHIRHVWIDDRVAILDLRSESYFALDPTASLMWREFTLGHDHDACLRNLICRFPDGSPQLELDFDAFGQRCIEAGWLIETRAATSQDALARSKRKPARRLLSLQAWWSLFRVTRLLSARGFSWTYNAVSQMAPADLGQGQDPDLILSAGLAAFARSEEFFHLKTSPADCLPRSLALFQFLRTLGLPAEHCIGVQQFPFSAHAWTQFRGNIVHDDPANRERYTVIARIPA